MHGLTTLMHSVLLVYDNVAKPRYSINMIETTFLSANVVTSLLANNKCFYWPQSCIHRRVGIMSRIINILLT